MSPCKAGATTIKYREDIYDGLNKFYTVHGRWLSSSLATF